MDSSCRNILLVTTCIALGLDLVAILYLVVTDMTGFSPAPVSTLCNAYLNAKYSTNRYCYSAGFAGSLTAILCLVGAVTALGLGRCKGTDYYVSCYLLLSGAVIGLAVLSATFLTLIEQQSGCLGGTNTDWVIIDALAWASLFPALSAWLINLILLKRQPQADNVLSDTVSFGGETPTPFGKMLLGSQQYEDNRSILAKHIPPVDIKSDGQNLKDGSRYIETIPRLIEEEPLQAQISWEMNSFGQVDPNPQRQVLHPRPQISPKSSHKKRSPKVKDNILISPSSSHQEYRSQKSDRKLRRTKSKEKIKRQMQKSAHSSVRQESSSPRRSKPVVVTNTEESSNSARSQERSPPALKKTSLAESRQITQEGPFGHLIQVDEVKQQQLQMLIFSKHSSLMRGKGKSEELAFSRSKKIQRKKLFTDPNEEKKKKEEEEKSQREVQNRLNRSTRDQEILRVLKEKFISDES